MVSWRRHIEQQRQVAFTLLELTISIAISTLVMSMTFQLLIMMTRNMTMVDKGSSAEDEVKRLNEYLEIALMAAGGSAIRPWAALQVQDNYQGLGPDRITVAELADHSLQCEIETMSSTLLTVDPTFGCCLVASFAKRQVIAITGDSDGAQHWENRYVESVNLTSCTANLKAGQASVLNNAPSSTSAYLGGTIGIVRLRVFWIDTGTSELKADEDIDLNGTIDTRVLADQIIDLQAALGYDVSPWDWHIKDNQNTLDEWLFNAAGDQLGKSGQGLAEAIVTDLRMVKFGVVMGLPFSGNLPHQKAQVLNGPLHEEKQKILRSFTGITGLRNHDVMR